MDELKKELYPGQKFKNYKELCGYLGEPTFGGKQKVLQLKDFTRFFTYEKVGHQFFITSVSDNPKAKKNQAVKYMDYVQNIMFYYFHLNTNDEMTSTSAELYKMLGMINSNYFTYRYEVPKLLRMNHSLTEEDVDEFYNVVLAKIYDILHRGLLKMEKEKFVTIVDSYRILEKGETEPRDADDEDIRYITMAERDILGDIGYREETQVFMNHTNKKYYSSLRDYFLGERNWVNVSKTHKLLFYHTDFADYENISVTEEKDGLNMAIIESLTKKFQKMYGETDVGKLANMDWLLDVLVRRNPHIEYTSSTDEDSPAEKLALHYETEFDFHDPELDAIFG